MIGAFWVTFLFYFPVFTSVRLLALVPHFSHFRRRIYVAYNIIHHL